MDRTQVLKFLNNYQQIVKSEDDQKFYLAICQVQLENYTEAQQLFEKSCLGMLKTRLWAATSQPNWLVDICILCGKADFYPKVADQLEAYKLDPRGDSLVASYAYALMELLAPSNNTPEITRWIQRLLKKPKVKDTFAMGIALQSIVNKDQIILSDALINLLKAHENMAKRGGLRETAEGLLCMPAMSLAYVALKYNMKMEIKNDYFSKGYLEYLSSSLD